MHILLSPPVSFVIYALFGLLIFLFGKSTAPNEDTTAEQKRALYGSGEEAPEERGVPGYKPFLLISLFFALLHLAVLVIGTSDMNLTAGIYTAVVMFGLLALIMN